MRNNYINRIYREVDNEKIEKRDLIIIFFLILVPAIISTFIVDYSLEHSDGLTFVSVIVMCICEVGIWIKWADIYASGIGIKMFKFFSKYIIPCTLLLNFWMWIVDNY